MIPTEIRHDRMVCTPIPERRIHGLHLVVIIVMMMMMMMNTITIIIIIVAVVDLVCWSKSLGPLLSHSQGHLRSKHVALNFYCFFLRNPKVQPPHFFLGSLCVINSVCSLASHVLNFLTLYRLHSIIAQECSLFVFFSFFCLWVKSFCRHLRMNRHFQICSAFDRHLMFHIGPSLLSQECHFFFSSSIHPPMWSHDRYELVSYIDR